jgi:Chitobiase/beta-hexosaminidase C-terminal domain/CotH kinase protein/Lamin Tail Domain/Bacterial TSP3 repeat
MIRHFGAVALLYLGLVVPGKCTLIFSTDATWKYFKGRTEASSPTTAWRSPGFNDSSWLSGAAPLGYGEPTVTFRTTLSDMPGGYTSVYLRRTFVVNNIAEIGSLELDTLSDDGYIAWINGVEVARFNVPGGSLAYNGTASTAIEPTAHSHTVTDLGNVLVVGTNVVAIHAFNASLSGSSDFVIQASLTSTAPDLTAPTVASVTPVPGTRNSLDQVTVQFSEPVTGVNPGDLLINGQPALSMIGGNDTYVFSFPQPAYGPVEIAWVTGHGIADFAVPPNPFDAQGPGAVWSYELVDNIPPAVSLLVPPAGATLRTLTQVAVTFTEPVAGLEASDLLVNDQPAAGVSVPGPGQYLFQFSEPATGTVQVAWAPGHGIEDLAVPPNPFAGGNWTYVLDPNAVIPEVRINEFLTANVNGLVDEDNEHQDWIELFNTGSNAINLAGWSLTDKANEPDQWIFPSVVLGARQYLVVFCSGIDRRATTPGAKLHTNFKLSPDGEYLGLYDNEFPRRAVSEFNPYPQQRGDYSYGYDGSDGLRYFRPPTPGAANGASSITGIVADTKFSHDRGFYKSNFSLTISSATPGATIRYTLDGSAPSLSTGLIYSSPILISKTTVVRALAFKAGLLETDVDSQTYLFLDDVIRQSSNGQAPAGWPSSWGGNTVDYGMDPDVVNNPLYSETIKDDLKAIPTFSIVMKLDDLFNSSSGIYANPGQDGIAWERPCSLELIYPDGGTGFQVNAGLRIRGGFSRSTGNPKHAFRVFFRQEYGASKLNFPVFGPTGAKSFDKFDLRTFQNYSWSFQGDSRQICLRDVFSRDAQLAMDRPSSRGDFYHLYINGVYWGLYNTDERPEASWGESYFGGREEDYDVIKVEAGPYTINATDGNMDAWTRLWTAANAGFANDVDYFKVQGLNVDGTPNPAYENLLDVPNLIDYMLVILYGGNLDAPISNFLGNNSPNNWYGIRNRTGLYGGFRFVAHDSEHTLLNVNEDRTGPYAAGDPAQGSNLSKSNPQYIWQKLQANAEFRMLVADHVQKHFFNGGIFTTDGAKNQFLLRSNQIDRAIVAESARWGDAKVTTPFTRATWVNAMNTVFTSFLGGRTAVVLNQLRTDGLFPSLAAPVFNRSGGLVPAGFQLTMTNPGGTGAILYTLNGIDPRLRGGGIHPLALTYGGPIPLNYQAHVKARVRNGTTWSALAEAEFFPDQDFDSLLLTEIMYHPIGDGVVPDDEFEFVELKNAGTNVLDLSGISFSEGVNFTFTNGTRLGPGAFWVLGRNPTQLAARYPGLEVQGVYSGKLDNGGERLTLVHPLGAKILSVSYHDGGRWPITPDGQGYSLVPRDPNANSDPDSPSRWRASNAPGGSPGADDPEPALPDVVINEVLTHTDPPLVDFIELYNPETTDADIGGWFLTDDAAVPKKFRIPDGTTIAAGGYLVFTEADFNPTPGLGDSFTLSSVGEQVYLLSGDAGGNLTGYSHGFSFGAAFNGVSFGRYVTSTGEEQFPAQIAVTDGGSNAGPRISPVVISHVMYHPPDLPNGADNQAEEYVELRNRTDQTVPLFDPAYPTNRWKLRDAVDFVFPANLTMEPGSSLLVVGFDPSNPAQLTAFHGKYPLLAALPIYGPFGGKLDNSMDSVELAQPDTPNPTDLPYVLVDKVEYQDAAPWPAAADGTGAALQRLFLAGYGNDPANWVAAAPLTIVTPPQGLTVRPGTKVIMSVNAIGTGTLRYQWRLNGLALAGATNDTYVILDAKEGDQGEYTVLVSDLSGTISSEPGFLSVLVDPYQVQPPLSQSVVQGGSVTFSVVSGGNLPMSYRWRKGASTLTNFTLNGHTAFYTVQNAQSVDAGKYTVVFTNAANFMPGILSSAATLTVLADTDGDGLPDDWESEHGLKPASALDAGMDSDGDGMTNSQEYIAGTDPQDPLSYLSVDRIDATGSARVSFQAVSNKTYTVQFRDVVNSGFWTKLADVAAFSTNRTAVVLDPDSVSRRFYRIITPQQP